jgi:hypothetical protein
MIMRIVLSALAVSSGPFLIDGLIIAGADGDLMRVISRL